MTDLKPVYLIGGDDDAKIDAWRARLRRRAEAERGPGSLEAFDADSAGPADLAAALATLSFEMGTRYLIAEEVGAWKAGSLGPLEAALAALPPDTVLVLIVRGTPSARLSKAVEKAGGETREYAAPRPWEMPKWVVERAKEEGLKLDHEAAKALVGVVGPRQQRLAREIEKLAITVHPHRQLTAEQIERLAAGETAPQVYDLADALVAGDLTASLALAEKLKTWEERPGRLVFPIVRRLREVHRAAALLDAGVPEQEVGKALRMPGWLAKRTVGKARKAEREALERALCVFADLELELRGGGELDEDTAFSLALSRAAG
jgi:DNA polymerase III subunit delta